MPFTTECPLCKKALSVPDNGVGNKVRCPSCQGVFVVEQREAITVEPLPTPMPMNDDDDESKRPRRYDDDDDDDRPARRPRKRRYDDDEDDYDDIERRRPLRSHRGGMIMTFGILSICLCCLPLFGFIFGASALNMASTDLPAMERGTMDDSGHGSTQTGKTCGTIGCVLSAIAFIGFVLLRVSRGA